MCFSEVKAGDRILISRTSSDNSIAAVIGYVASVTMVRAKSFDAGGLCFRRDGREWSGRSRAYPIPRTDEASAEGSMAKAGEEIGLEASAWPREDVMPAFMLSSRTEDEWLSLGLAELRRVAALLGVRLVKSA